MPNSKNITFDQLQSALTRVKNSLDKKANTSHGNHVPKTETANNARFLRNDNTWQTITPVNIGAANASHGTHVTYGGNGSATTVSRSDHTHSYIPLGGSSSITGNLEFSNSGTTTRGVIGTMGDNDYWRIVGGATASNSGYLEIATADDANEPIYVRQYGSGKFGTLTRTATLLDASGNTSFPGTVTAPTFSGTLTGNASSANLLLSTAGRPESANTPVVAGPSIALMLATSTMKTGKPITDGYITEYRWDSSGGWSSQLFVPNGNKPMQFRYMDSGTWKDWYTIYSSNNPQTTITGNAGSATKLQNARTINGTSFNGTGNITTANWGTARNITIGNTAKSVNGSGNVSWSLSEIGAAAASHTHDYASSSHNHGLLHSNLTVSVANTTTDNGWSMINSSYNGYILKSIRSNANAPAWLQGNYAAGIAFGGEDTKGVMSVAYNAPSIRFAGGNGTKPVWNMTLTGTSGKSYNMDSLAANTANTLAAARTINGTSFNGSGNITTANWGTGRTITIGNKGKTVNGSGNVSWSLSEIGALPAAGGTVSGNLNVTGAFSIGGKKITINSSAPSSPAVGDIWIKI